MKSNLASLSILSVLLVTHSAWAQVPPPPAPDDRVEIEGEVLARGPIHEAYAEPLELPDEEPFVLPSEPPAPIEELPPDVKPEGKGAVWISGYWSWDDERRDYIWVSGVWRIPPQGRTWVSGRWESVPGGFRWVPGQWVPVDGFVAETVPLPPPNLDQGPTSNPLSDDFFWVPGCWRHQAGRYVWRPGFWSPSHEQWVWVPDYYVPTPQGCVFVPGYWDYGWEQRGILYAPLYVNRQVLRPGYYYRPSVVVDVSGAFFHLWVRPSYSHYYFGDYYDNSYVGFGFTPWYSYHRHYRHAYDPLFVHNNWRFRRDHVDLYQHMRVRHQRAHENVTARPPKRFDHAQAIAARGGEHATSNPRGADVLTYRANQHRQHIDGHQHRDAVRQNVLQTQRELINQGVVTAPPTRSGPNASRGGVTPDVLTNRRNLPRPIQGADGERLDNRAPRTTENAGTRGGDARGPRSTAGGPSSTDRLNARSRRGAGDQGIVTGPPAATQDTPEGTTMAPPRDRMIVGETGPQGTRNASPPSRDPRTYAVPGSTNQRGTSRNRVVPNNPRGVPNQVNPQSNQSTNRGRSSAAPPVTRDRRATINPPSATRRSSPVAPPTLQNPRDRRGGSQSQAMPRNQPFNRPQAASVSASARQNLTRPDRGGARAAAPRPQVATPSPRAAAARVAPPPAPAAARPSARAASPSPPMQIPRARDRGR